MSTTPEPDSIDTEFEHSLSPRGGLHDTSTRVTDWLQHSISLLDEDRGLLTSTDVDSDTLLSNISPVFEEYEAPAHLQADSIFGKGNDTAPDHTAILRPKPGPLLPWASDADAEDDEGSLSCVSADEGTDTAPEHRGGLRRLQQGHDIMHIEDACRACWTPSEGSAPSTPVKHAAAVHRLDLVFGASCSPA